MLSYARDARDFATGIEKSDFIENREKQYAIVRALEVVGEAAKGVDADVRAIKPEVPWRQIAAMRDKLIHHYFGVRLDEVWSVLDRDVPDLITHLESLVGQLEN